MPKLTPSGIRRLLEENQIRLTKSLGQNFLHDANQLGRIVSLAELTRQDKVLEIGPGLGPLTERLVETASEVLAIEKDARLLELLTRRLATPREGGAAALRLIHADALGWLRSERRDWSQWKLVSNLPYSVASPLLVELACGTAAPQAMVVTLQIEVAKRLLATAGEEDYGLLTLLVQVDYVPRRWFRIPAGCFYPAPKVDSACIGLSRREQPLVEPTLREDFVRIVKRSFSQRRKMMVKLLREDWPAAGLERAFARVGLPLQTRAELVTLEQFVRLTETLSARLDR